MFIEPKCNSYLFRSKNNVTFWFLYLFTNISVCKLNFFFEEKHRLAFVRYIADKIILATALTELLQRWVTRPQMPWSLCSLMPYSLLDPSLASCYWLWLPPMRCGARSICHLSCVHSRLAHSTFVALHFTSLYLEFL